MSMSDKQLMDEAQCLHDCIKNIDCFNSHDVMKLDKLMAQLEERGYEIQIVSTLRFYKVEE